MATIEKRYLAPLNPTTTITEADRAMVYGNIAKQLADVLTGAPSYYPDGVQKGADARASDLDDFIGSLSNMQFYVNDPSNILGAAIGELRKHVKDVRDQLDKLKSADHIEMSPALSPTTKDSRIIYVDPQPDLYSSPNPLSPKNWPKDLKVSLTSPDRREPPRTDMSFRRLSGKADALEQRAVRPSIFTRR